MEIQRYSLETARHLGAYYRDRREAESLSRRLLEAITGRDYPEMILSDYKLTEKEADTLLDYTDRLLRHEPLQYILGRADFGELTLLTDPHVLIPRPDTAELCDILEEKGWLSRVTRIADLGTGSGAIALLLAHRHPTLRVIAVDLSPHALDLTQRNALALGLDERVEVLEGDLLSPHFALPREVELVVSNPPYILEHERAEMAPHVLEREPEEALFVPDDDPLLYYRAILDRCPAPRYALEINPLAAEALSGLLEERGYRVSMEKGLQGEARFILAERHDDGGEGV